MSALVVEDGTGITGADSYISIADAETYFTAWDYSGSWDNFTPTDGSEPVQQEIALRQATRAIDFLYGCMYPSYPLTTTQSLLIPRQPYCNQFGGQTTGLPACVANATAEMALLILNGFDPLDNTDDTGRLKEARTDVGAIKTINQYFFPINYKALTLARIASILSPALDPTSNGAFARVLRG